MPIARPLLRVVLAALALALLAQPALAQWKWRDKNGRVTVSDLPPPRDVPDKDVLQRPEVAPPKPAAEAASAAAPAIKPPQDAELLARKKAADQEQAAKSSAETERLNAQRAENCRNARGHLAAMESGQRMARINDKGEREILDDKQRADEARRARDVIASDCR